MHRALEKQAWNAKVPALHGEDGHPLPSGRLSEDARGLRRGQRPHCLHQLHQRPVICLDGHGQHNTIFRPSSLVPEMRELGQPIQVGGEAPAREQPDLLPG